MPKKNLVYCVNSRRHRCVNRSSQHHQANTERRSLPVIVCSQTDAAVDSGVWHGRESSIEAFQWHFVSSAYFLLCLCLPVAHQMTQQAEVRQQDTSYFSSIQSEENPEEQAFHFGFRHHALASHPHNHVPPTCIIPSVTSHILSWITNFHITTLQVWSGNRWCKLNNLFAQLNVKAIHTPQNAIKLFTSLTQLLLTFSCCCVNKNAIGICSLIWESCTEVCLSPPEAIQWGSMAAVLSLCEQVLRSHLHVDLGWVRKSFKKDQAPTTQKPPPCCYGNRRLWSTGFSELITVGGNYPTPTEAYTQTLCTLWMLLCLFWQRWGFFFLLAWESRCPLQIPLGD